MESIASPALERKVTVGVDTHKHLHVAVALDELGARLGELTWNSPGYAELRIAGGIPPGAICGAVFGWSVALAVVLIPIAFMGLVIGADHWRR